MTENDEHTHEYVTTLYSHYGSIYHIQISIHKTEDTFWISYIKDNDNSKVYENRNVLPGQIRRLLFWADVMVKADGNMSKGMYLATRRMVVKTVEEITGVIK